MPTVTVNGVPHYHEVSSTGPPLVLVPDFGPRPWGWEPDRVLPKGAIAGGCC